MCSNSTEHIVLKHVFLLIFIANPSVTPTPPFFHFLRKKYLPSKQRCFPWSIIEHHPILLLHNLSIYLVVNWSSLKNCYNGRKGEQNLHNGLFNCSESSTFLPKKCFYTTRYTQKVLALHCSPPHTKVLTWMGCYCMVMIFTYVSIYFR